MKEDRIRWKEERKKKWKELKERERERERERDRNKTLYLVQCCLILLSNKHTNERTDGSCMRKHQLDGERERERERERETY